MKNQAFFDNAFDHMRKILVRTKPRGVLLNGSIEDFLKSVFASSVDPGGRYRYVMDKEFDKHEVDLLVIDNDAAKIAIEFKSTLMTHSRYCETSVVDALNKARKSAVLQKSNEQFSACESYVVHFLTAPYPERELPSFVDEKFPRQHPVDMKWLRKLYAENLGVPPGRIMVKDVIGSSVSGLKGVRIQAVVARIPRAETFGVRDK